MSHLGRGTNGRPEPEVIVNYIDGYAYSKGKMEEAFRSGLFADRPVLNPKPPVNPKDVRKEDVELLVSEFEIPKAQAERVLSQHGGDVNQALQALIMP